MLSVRVAHNGPEAVLHVAGEIDMATGPQLRQAMVSAIADGATTLVLDLGEVSFVDSVGLGIIIGGLKRTRTHGGDLRLRTVPERFAAVLELTGLDRVVVVDPPVVGAP